MRCIIGSRACDANSVEARPRTGRVRVGETRHAWPALQVAGHLQEWQRGRQVPTPLQRIGNAGDALPTNGHVCAIRRRGEQAQHRERVGGVGLAAPLLPVAHAVAVRVRGIRRGVGGRPYCRSQA